MAQQMTRDEARSVINNCVSTGTYCEELYNALDTASSYYYNTYSSIVTDEVFDKAKDIFNKEHPTVFPIGAEPLDGKYANPPEWCAELLGSLDKVNVVGEFIKEFLQKNFLKSPRFKKLKKLSFRTSPKFDGCSVLILYEKGKVVNAYTRGRDGRSRDITEALKQLPTIAYKNGTVAVKCEAIMSFTSFAKMVEDLELDYVNPRSFVSGKLSDNNLKDYVKYFSFVPLRVKIMDGWMGDFQEFTKKQEVEFIKKYLDNFEIKFSDYAEEFEITDDMTEKQIKTMCEEMYQKRIDQRSSIDCMLDGIVIEVDDVIFRSQLGRRDDIDLFGIAFKFPYMEKETKVIGIDFDTAMSPTGIITPCVRFEPVKFNNAEQKRVSLANYKRFMELKLCVGTTGIIQYRNDVLSYFTKIDSEENEALSNDPKKVIPFIDKCNVCGGKVINDGVFAYCGNPECENKVIGRFVNHLIKMGIKGVEAQTIKKLFEGNLIVDLSDLYTVDFSKVTEDKIPEGMGRTSLDNVGKAIKEKKEIYDYEILGSVGIDSIGITIAKKLFSNSELSLYDILDKVHENSDELYKEIIKLEGFSDIRTKQLIDGVIDRFDDIASLYNNLEFKSIREEIAKNSSGEQYKFVITGELKNWDREVIKVELEKLGHKVIGSVSSKTSYLVTNDTASGTVKNKKAKELGIPIINEDQLMELTGLVPLDKFKA